MKSKEREIIFVYFDEFDVSSIAQAVFSSLRLTDNPIQTEIKGTACLAVAFAVSNTISICFLRILNKNTDNSFDAFSDRILVSQN